MQYGSVSRRQRAALTLLLGAVAAFRDDFDGGALNRSTWNVEVNCDGGGNQEAQCYVDDPANIFVSDGVLSIVAQRAANGDVTSGRLNTLGNVERTYGRWEARVQVPAVLGTWAAFWTLGADFESGGWPACGEIDIMENFQRGDANSDSLYSTAHSLAHSWGTNTALQGGYSPPLDHDEFHVVRLDWREDSLTFFVDGNQARATYHTITEDRIACYMLSFSVGAAQTWRLDRAADSTNYDWHVTRLEPVSHR